MKYCSLGDFLGHGPKCPYSLSISHPHSQSWSSYIAFPWFEGGVSRRNSQRPHESVMGGGGGMVCQRQKIEKICGTWSNFGQTRSDSQDNMFIQQ